MERLISTMKLDARVQFRHKFYYISIGTAVLLGLGIRQVSNPQLAVTLLMVLFLTAVCVMATAYIAALVVFERDQHTLNALFVSPLRLTEYLNSKIITLTTLVTVEGVTLVLVSLGALGTNWSLLIAGTALLGVTFTLFGTILIVRFATITSFLMPAGLLTLFLELPAIYFAGLSDSPLWLLIPTSAPMMLIWGAWHTMELWQTVYALAYSTVILGIGYSWATGAFTRHILVRQGS